jgi:hypothetical protein
LRQKPSSERVKSFLSNDIVALLGLNPNERYLSIPLACELLGIEQGPQLRRIRAHALLLEGLRNLVLDEDYDTNKKTPCLRLDLVPLWLATIELKQVGETAREQVLLFQREVASILWQSFKPQGYSPEDVLLPTVHEMQQSEGAYQAELAMATLARHQMLIERQLESDSYHHDDDQLSALRGYREPSITDANAVALAQSVRRVASTLSARTRRNEYGGIYSGLYRQFGISSYRRLPPGRLREALDWLERWHGDLLGEPEPPPDI